MNGVGIAVVEWLIKAVRGYLFAGLVFSIPFLLFGIQRLDPDARGWWRIGFRIIIIPGLCVFWPLFAVRWVRGKRTPVERNAHRLAAPQSPAT
ncbi:MAG: hypothetical protein F6K42_03780 [Leptolyngbya sp. SIO1D8]|nr:hypothetical protein [Leptolyngbya sp. SIO1D8]